MRPYTEPLCNRSLRSNKLVLRPSTSAAQNSQQGSEVLPETALAAADSEAKSTTPIRMWPDAKRVPRYIPNPFKALS